MSAHGHRKGFPRIAAIGAVMLLGVAAVAGTVMLMGQNQQDRTGPANPGTPGSGPASDEAPSIVAPAVGDRSEADEYRAAVIALNGEITQQLDALTLQLVVPKYDDLTWREDTRAVLEQMTATADKARRIEPTSPYAASHEVWLEGIDAFAWVAENLATAIAEPDYALISQCDVRLTEASARFREATNLMQQVVAD